MALSILQIASLNNIITLTPAGNSIQIASSVTPPHKNALPLPSESPQFFYMPAPLYGWNEDMSGVYYCNEDYKVYVPPQPQSCTFSDLSKDWELIASFTKRDWGIDWLKVFTGISGSKSHPELDEATYSYFDLDLFDDGSMLLDNGNSIYSNVGQVTNIVKDNNPYGRQKYSINNEISSLEPINARNPNAVVGMASVTMLVPWLVNRVEANAWSYDVQIDFFKTSDMGNICVIRSSDFDHKRKIRDLAGNIIMGRSSRYTAPLSKVNHSNVCKAILKFFLVGENQCDTSVISLPSIFANYDSRIYFSSNHKKEDYLSYLEWVDGDTDNPNLIQTDIRYDNDRVEVGYSHFLNFTPLFNLAEFTLPSTPNPTFHYLTFNVVNEMLKNTI